MIRLFKSVRNPNKTGSYFKYAFGEIILVVAGILIALQINNWNESRIRSNEELELLKSMLAELVSDQSDIAYNTTVIDKSIYNGKLLIDMIQRDLPYTDSVDIYLGRLFSPVKFRHSTSAFETLKSKGIELISNSALRSQIIDNYDAGYNFFLENETVQLEEFERATREIFCNRFEAGYVFDLNAPDYNPTLTPLNFEELKSDQAFKYFLKTYVNRLRVMLLFHYQSNLQPGVNDLIEQIQNEIDKKD